MVGDRGHTAAIPNGMCEPNTVRQETFEGRNFRVLKKHISRRKLPCIFAGYSIQILPPTKFAEKTFMAGSGSSSRVSRYTHENTMQNVNGVF